jgi:hypothetical protein
MSGDLCGDLVLPGISAGGSISGVGGLLCFVHARTHARTHACMHMAYDTVLRLSMFSLQE